MTSKSWKARKLIVLLRNTALKNFRDGGGTKVQLEKA